jgi:hypothetical protein
MRNLTNTEGLGFFTPQKMGPFRFYFRRPWLMVMTQPNHAGAVTRNFFYWTGCIIRIPGHRLLSIYKPVKL